MVIGLRHKIVGLVSILSIMLVAAMSVDAIHNYQILDKGNNAITANEAADNLIVAAGSWAVERGTTAGVLGKGGEATGKQKGVILERRQIADTAMEKALDLIAHTNDQSLVAHELETLKTKYEAVKALRTRVDAVIQAGSLNQDPDLRKDWFGGITGLIVASANVRKKEEIGLLSGATKSVVEAVSLRNSAWIWAEFAGRERGRLAGVIASGKPMTEKQAAIVRQLSITIGSAIEEMKIIKGDMPPNVVDKIDHAYEIYVKEITPLRERVFQASSDGAPYPISGQEWFDQATKSIKAVLAASLETRTFITSEVEEDVSITQLILIIETILVAAAFVIWGVSWWFATAKISKPIEEMVEVMHELAGGNLEIFVPEARSKDEIGKMAKAVYRFKQESRANEKYRSEQEIFKQQVSEEQRSLLLGVADDFETAVGGVTESLASSATELAANATQVQATAEDSAKRGATVHSEAAKTAQEVRNVASSAQALDTAIQDVSQQVATAASQTAEASQKAADAANRVDRLNERSAAIRDVVNLISDIAEQTNLLALNATIEAARAGDHGKGFAVVANEVKALASQTQKATDEIGSEINNMLTEIGATTEAVKTIAETASTVRTTVETVVTAAHEQRETTREIASSMETTANRMDEVKAETEVLAEMAATTGSAVTQVASAAEELSSSSDVLQRESTQFLEQIRREDEEQPQAA